MFIEAVAKVLDILIVIHICIYVSTLAGTHWGSCVLFYLWISILSYSIFLLVSAVYKWAHSWLSSNYLINAFILFITFSSLDCQKADWIGIHEKICDRLAYLRQPAPFLASREDRDRRQKDVQLKKVFLHIYTSLIIITH